MSEPGSRDHPLGGTLFSFLLLIAACVFLSFTSVRTYVLFGSYTGLTDHFNTIGVIFLVFWLVVISLGLRLLHPFLGLSAANLACVYAALMVATVLPSMGFGGYFIPLLAGVFYYASPENKWESLIWDHIPDWVVPHDLEAIRQLFEGVGPHAPIPWEVWAKPLIYGGLFAFAFFLVSLALISLIHHQWSRQERLVYPLAVVPSLLLDHVENPVAGILRKRLLWVGFFVAWCLPTINMLDQVFDFEAIQGFGIPGFTIQVQRLGISFGLNTDLLVVGLSYLVNLDVLFSVWLFHILVTVEEGLLGFLGITLPLPAQPHAPGNVLLAHQQVGSLIFIVAASLWTARPFLAQQWRAIVGGGPSERTNLIPPRWAALLGLAGLLYMAGFLHATGLHPGWTILFLLISLVVFFGTARLLAQTGIGRLRAATSIPPIMTNLFGTSMFGGRGLTAMGLSFTWTADIQLFVMGTLAHAFRVCEAPVLRISGRRLVFTVVAAMVVGLVTTIVSYVWLGYRHGLIHGYAWYFVMSPNYHWSWVANSISNPNAPEPLAAVFLLIGAGLAGLLSLASHHMAGWPLHPVGLAIALTNTVRIDWFGIFLAWLVKLVVLRYGGAILYRRALPLFIGLILGSCVGVGGAALVYAFYYY